MLKRVTLLLVALLATASAQDGKKLADLPSLLGADVQGTLDLILINDTSAGTGASKTITPTQLSLSSPFITGNFLEANAIEFNQINGLTGALSNLAPKNNAIFTGTFTVPDNAIAFSKINGLQAAFDLKANAANPTFTGTISMPDNAIAFSKINGLQTALDAKAPLANPAFTGTLGAAAITATGKIATTLITEQLRLGYDGSNHVTATVASNGLVTLNATGAGAAFVFSDNISAANLSGTNTGDQDLSPYGRKDIGNEWEGDQSYSDGYMEYFTSTNWTYNGDSAAKHRDALFPDGVADGDIIVFDNGSWVRKAVGGDAVMDGDGNLAINDAALLDEPVTDKLIWYDVSEEKLKGVTVSGSNITFSDGTLAVPTQIENDTMIVAMSDETTAIALAAPKVTLRAPYAMTITGVKASLTTVSSSGLPTVDINVGGSSILTTKLTIDASEKTSVTAATAAVISGTTYSVSADAEITLDIDVAGTGATGLKVYIQHTHAP